MSGRRSRKKHRQPLKRSKSQPSDAFLHQFKVAAAEGAVIELKLRILAEKIPAIEHLAHAKVLEDVEKPVVAWFGNSLSAADAELLDQCRKLRNKLLHCDFCVARERLHATGASRQGGGVRRISLEGANDGTSIMERLIAGASGVPGSYTEVADAKSTKEASIFGWLMELGSAGDLVRSAQVFRRAADLVDRLIVQVDEIRENESESRPTTVCS